MDKDLIGKYLTIASIAAIGCFACGIHITNSALKTYHLLDFSLLQPRAILVGFAFIVFMALHFFVFLILIKIPIENNSVFKTLFITGIKVAYLAVALTFAFNTELLDNLFLFGWELNDVFSKILLGLFIYMPFAGMYYHDARLVGKKDLLDKLNLAHFLVCVAGAILFFLAISTKEEFESLFQMEMNFGFHFITIILVAVNRKLRPERKNDGFFLFEDSVSADWKSNFYKIFIALMLITMTFGLTARYIKDVYFHVPQSYGGGKLEQMTYVTESDTITGYKIYETESYIFIENKDSSITKIDWADVAKVIYK